MISQIQKAEKETDHAKRSALYTSQFDIFIMHYLQQSLIFWSLIQFYKARHYNWQPTNISIKDHAKIFLLSL